MEHIAAIMVLIGCGHGDAECMEIPAPQVAYETVEECETSMEDALLRASNERPVVYGQCEAVDPALFEGDAVVAWDFDANGALLIDVSSADTLFAESETDVVAQ